MVPVASAIVSVVLLDQHNRTALVDSITPGYNSVNPKARAGAVMLHLAGPPVLRTPNCVGLSLIEWQSEGILSAQHWNWWYKITSLANEACRGRRCRQKNCENRSLWNSLSILASVSQRPLSSERRSSYPPSICQTSWKSASASAQIPHQSSLAQSYGSCHWHDHSLWVTK